jgi:hypothetical protein
VYTTVEFIILAFIFTPGLIGTKIQQLQLDNCMSSLKFHVCKQIPFFGYDTKSKTALEKRGRKLKSPFFHCRSVLALEC